MKKTTPDQKSSPLTIQDKDTSTATQQLQVSALIKQHQSRNTPEFRQHGIMQPASRIKELKEQGHNIQKVLETYTDELGKVHHGVARYYDANNPPANDTNKEKAA